MFLAPFNRYSIRNELKKDDQCIRGMEGVAVVSAVVAVSAAVVVLEVEVTIAIEVDVEVADQVMMTVASEDSISKYCALNTVEFPRLD